MKTQKQIESVCDSIKNMLLEKNKKYGDSALSPVRIFSKADAVEQILVRIDDKLSRISKGVGLVAADEDVVNDLIGYLILLKIAKQQDSSQWDGSDIEPTPGKQSATMYDDIISFNTNSVEQYFGNNMANSWISCSQEDATLADVYSSGDRFA
jgi:hypothetical protein